MAKLWNWNSKWGNCPICVKTAAAVFTQIGQFPHFEFQFHNFAISHEFHSGGVTRSYATNEVRQLRGALDGVTIELDDDITFLQA